MLLMFEKGTQGGITHAVHQYMKANNKYMSKKFHPKEESSFLHYIDANNLYGWVMYQPLPTRGFKWVNELSTFTPDEIDRLAKHDSKGYLLEVDVKYSEGLHDLHNDLPFMCEKMKINKVEKLVSNLYDKRNT